MRKYSFNIPSWKRTLYVLSILLTCGFLQETYAQTATIASSSDVSCAGSCTGTATVVATGGISPYTFLWDGNAGFQTTATAINLCAGAYSVTVTDAGGASDIASVIINEPSTTLQITTTIISDYNGQDISCNGTCDGVAVGIPVGGTAPYTFHWDSGATTDTLHNACPGTYSLTVTDASGCTNFSSVTLTEPIAVTATLTSIQNPSCGACTDGTVTVIGSGGTPGYSYQLTNNPLPSNNGTFTNLPNGNTCITVTDLNFCQATTCASLSSTTVLVSNISVAGQGGAASVDENNTLQMETTITPSNATNQSVSWSLTNGTGTATISTTGLLTGISSGTVTVCATANDGSGVQNCTNINVTPNGAICQNGTFFLNATGLVTVDINQLLVNQNPNLLIDGPNGAASTVTYSCNDVGLQSVDIINMGLPVTTVCNSLVTIIDSVSPIVSCQNFTANLDATGNVTILPSDIDSGSSDNCGIVDLSINGQTSLSFSAADIGQQVVTLTATDASGNSSSCVSIITIQDNIAPIALCQDLLLNISSTNGQVVVNAQDVDGGSTDNIAINNILINGQPSISFSTADVGVNTVTLTVTDVAGNTSSCNANITITNTLVPSLSGQIAIDANNDCILDTGEIPFNQATIRIDDNNGVIYNTSPDANGYYSISLPAGSYDLEIIMNGNTSLTSCLATQQVTIPANQTAQTIDWSINAPNIMGRIAIDANNDCLVDMNEQGVTKTIVFNQGNNYTYVYSDVNGYYFVDLPVGTYTSYILSSLNGLYACQATQQVIVNTSNQEVNWSIGEANFSGRVVIDANNNCLADSSENGLQGIIITFEQNGLFYSTSTYDTLGNYEIMLPNIGMYTATAHHPNNYNACANSIAVSLPTLSTSTTLDWTLEEIVACPDMQVSISAPFLRMTNGGSWYSVSYSNQGTTTATNAYVTVELDPFLIYQGVSSWYGVTLVSQVGNLYTFDLGNVDPYQYGYFSVNVLVDPTAFIGQTHCTEAHIYPDSSCALSAWNGAIIDVVDSCHLDSISFYIENFGADMNAPLNYTVYEDNVIVQVGTFMLNQGQIQVVNQTAQAGMTYRIVAEQEVGYPAWMGDQTVTIFAENCNPAASFTGISRGFGLQFSNGNTSPYIDIDCQQNVASYDPNDKLGMPIGYGEDFMIYANTPIDYRVRFQNTGTDTAFNIVIRDTLSAHLDLSTLQMGASSHPYNWSIVNGNVLLVEFNNIMLPDSNVNEPASNGFFKYNIQQLQDNPIGTVIENSAAIYFDFNPPIITNTTVHTIGEDFEVSIISTEKIENNTESHVSIYPNPFNNVTNIVVDGGDYNTLNFEVYDIQGRQVRMESSNNMMIEFYRNDLPSGVYFYQLRADGQLLDTGKIVVQ